jgi:hypothetical protein
MKSFEASLRLLIEKWIGPPVASQVSLTRYGRAHSFEPRYVRVEARRAGGAVAIFFFQHRDGTWHVFPAEPGRVSMSVS